MAATFLNGTSGNVYIEVNGVVNNYINYSTTSLEISYRAPTTGYNGNIYV